MTTDALHAEAIAVFTPVAHAQLCVQFCLRKLKDGGEPGKQIGKISFIDLAGSERGAGKKIPLGYALAADSVPKCVADMTHAICFPQSRSVCC